VRISARLRSPWLDRRLADGTASWSSSVLAARALQLTSTRYRVAMARSLEALVEMADRPRGSRLDSVVPPCREQVREARPAILAISSRLRSRQPVNARGVARLRRLLSDGCGPCYARAEPRALTEALEAIEPCLDVAG
jgi:hypothetical protein